MSGRTAALAVSSLSRHFGKTRALSNVSLQVDRGSVFGLVGENGAGKTTLVKHLLGLLAPQTGSATVFGIDPVGEPERALARVGYLAEHHELPDWIRLDELLHFTRAFYPGWDDEYARSLCEEFELDPTRRVKTLSKGQRARAALVAAIAYRPDVLILDEPSSGLDPVARRDLLETVIRSVVSDGRTVLFSSHLLDEVERVADHVAMLSRGEVLIDAPLERVVESHRLVAVRFSENHWTERSVPDLDGAIRVRGNGREWTFLFEGAAERIPGAVEDIGGEVVSVSYASLDEIFVSRTRQTRR